MRKSAKGAGRLPYPDGALIESDVSNNTLEMPRTIPGAIANATSATLPGGPGGPLEISGSIVGPEIPIYLPDAIHQDPGGPQKCALRHGDCYAAADPSTLSFQIVSGPANGTASVVAANGLSATVQYTPNPGFIGPDSFTFVATDTRGFQSAPATATITVADVLLSLAPPTITGAAAVGQQLSASHGTWSPEPTSRSYQWQRCNAAGSSCANIGGSTGASYTVRPADGASSLRVVETATHGNKSGSASSATTAVVPGVARLSENRLIRTLFKGTRKADTITGTRKHDLIKSGRGSDTVKARASADIIKSGNGKDLVFAGKGKDVVVAGRGNDDIRALDKMVDKINCGPGFDNVLADLIDKIHKSCEDVTMR